MDVPIDLLNVQAGDEIRAGHIRGLATAVEERTFVEGAGVRLHRIPGFGAMVEAEPQDNSWIHPWLSYLSGARAHVVPGAVNTLMPWLDGRPLDGLDDEGNADPKGKPTLSLRADLFTPEGYSWGVVRAKIDPATGKLLKPSEGGLTLAQTDVVTWQDGGSIDKDGTGDQPIFQLRRRPDYTKGLGVLSQISFFNMNHRFVRGEGEQPGRHFFYV